MLICSQKEVYINSVSFKKDIVLHLNFNSDGDAQNDKLISPLTRVTVTSEIPAIKFLGVFIDPLLNLKFHMR